MKSLGNLLWLLCGGLLSGLLWIVEGCLWYATIIGIPVGKQCFRFASLSFHPFGKQVILPKGMSQFRFSNVFWFLFGGFVLAAGNFLIGVVLCATIIGIPFGRQFFKIAKLSLAPFGARII